MLRAKIIDSKTVMYEPPEIVEDGKNYTGAIPADVANRQGFFDMPERDPPVPSYDATKVYPEKRYKLSKGKIAVSYEFVPLPPVVPSETDLLRQRLNDIEDFIALAAYGKGDAAE
jgi:hypothetical protein